MTRVAPSSKLDPYGFARYQGQQKERDAVLAHLSRCAAGVKDGTPAGEVLYDEYFELIDDITEERHHHA